MYSKVNKNAIIGEDTTTSKSKNCIYMTKKNIKNDGKDVKEDQELRSKT